MNVLESWFTIDEKHPIAFAKVEIIEATEVKPSDSNGRSRYVCWPLKRMFILFSYYVPVK